MIPGRNDIRNHALCCLPHPKGAPLDLSAGWTLGKAALGMTSLPYGVSRAYPSSEQRTWPVHVRAVDPSECGGITGAFEALAPTLVPAAVAMGGLGDRGIVTDASMLVCLVERGVYPPALEEHLSALIEAHHNQTGAAESGAFFSRISVVV